MATTSAIVPVSSSLPATAGWPGVLPRPTPLRTRSTWRGSGVLAVSPATGLNAGAAVALGALFVSPATALKAGAAVVEWGELSGRAWAAAASAHVIEHDASAS